jgi:hypothetical protein
LSLVYTRKKLKKFPISVSKKCQKFHPKKIIDPEHRNTTTLGFHGITMGTHNKAW